jgi:multidrug resistance efflux pump
VKITIAPDAAARAGWLRAGLSVTAEVDTRDPPADRVGVLGAAMAAIARP